ncbi:MAG: CHAT domain-containing protein [Cytophagales bacterium]|nr:CHAT domain-containing protein [Cytophagales bacterium]
MTQSIDQLIERAQESLNANHWVNAELQFNSILENRLDDLSRLQKANIYNNLGDINLKLIDSEKAEYHMNLAIQFHEEAGIPNKMDYSHALQNMGLLLLELTEFDQAKNYIKKGVEIAQEVGDKLEIVNARSKLARLYEESGHYVLAYDIFSENHDSLLELGDELSDDFAEVCSHMGRMLLRNGRPTEAESFIQKSTEIYSKLGSGFDVERAESMESLGMFYEQLGRYSEAERILLEVLAIKRAIPDEADVLILATLNDLGILYRDLGNFEKAEEMFQEVVNKSRETIGVDHPMYATAINNLALTDISNGNFIQAQSLLLESLQIYENKYGKNHPLSAHTLNNLAHVERRLGNYELAETYYKRVLKLDEMIYGKLHPDYATTLLNIGVLKSVQGRGEEAVSYYLESIDIRLTVLGEDHPSYASALEKMGMHFLGINNLSQAELYFRWALEIQIRKVRTVFPILTESERELFYLTIKEDIERYNYIAFSLLEDRPEFVKHIFDFNISTKAILFNSANRIKDKIERGDEELKSLHRDWKREKRLLTNYYAMGTQELEANHIDLSRTEQRVQNIEKQLVFKLEDFKGMLVGDNENWQGVQDQINPNEAVVEIIRIREFKAFKSEKGIVYGFTDFTQYLAIIFTENTIEGPEYVILGDDYKTEDVWYARYRNSFLYGIDQMETFNMLWKPVHDKIGNVKEVKVSPDGIFYKMNPNAFSLPNGEFLIEKYYVSYLTSCKDLFRDDVESYRNRTFLFGNPAFSRLAQNNSLKLAELKGAEYEINSVSKLLEDKGWNPKTYLNDRASESSLRSSFNATILHVATHGFFGDEANFLNSTNRETNPLFRSGLFLANASDTYNSYLDGHAQISDNDGVLTAYEAMNLDLSKTKLVILSACESGLGDIRNGEGVFGLQRAFMVAGARNLIISFAKVDDAATGKLMISFYENLLQTEAIGQSLRDAQLKLKESYPDPKIWGAFMLIGNG